jgi:hypothetical protein
VGSVDGRFKLNDHWTLNAQGAYSVTINPQDGTFNQFGTTGGYQAGNAAEVLLQRDGLKLHYFLDYSDRSPNFRTLTCFDPQPDIRNLDQRVQYTFRPGQTFLTALYAQEMERLRPQDFSSLKDIQKYVRHTTEFAIDSNYFQKVILHADYRFGTRVNYDAPTVQALSQFPVTPFLARRMSANATITIRPTRSLKVDNTYIMFRLHSLDGSFGAMNNHIIRSKWNYQFTKELSFRFIGQYSTVLSNPYFTSLQTTKNFNADFLITYLVHPSTAVYVGYNSNLENLNPNLGTDVNGELLHSLTGRLLNDGRNFFVKASYLYRF